MASVVPGPGTLVGQKYRIERELGRGGMGMVLAAVHAMTGRKVALKTLHPAAADGPGAVARLLEEARVVAGIRHPHVADVYDVVEDGGQTYLVMELLEGEPLGTLMRRGELTLPAAFALLVGAMRGVAAAHAHGVIHRDIKPDNIFVVCSERGDLQAKVLDFGIAKATAGDRTTLTESGVALGTPAYMALEQLDDARTVDARADVYAFGVILYELAVGKPPFSGRSLPEIIAKMLSGVPTRVDELRPELPAPLACLIDWATARERDQRVPTIDALIAELENFASPHAFRAQMVDPGGPLPRIGKRGSPGIDALTDTAKAPPSSASVDPSDSGTFDPPAVPKGPGERGKPVVLTAVGLLLASLGLIAWLSVRQDDVSRQTASAAVSGGGHQGRRGSPAARPESVAGRASSLLDGARAASSDIAVVGPARRVLPDAGVTQTQELPSDVFGGDGQPGTAPERPHRDTLRKRARPARGPVANVSRKPATPRSAVVPRASQAASRGQGGAGASPGQGGAGLSQPAERRSRLPPLRADELRGDQF